MGKRGPKPKNKIKIKWSDNFAYAIGLIVTDGNLSKSGHRISFASKDLEQIENFKKCLDIKNKIGIHHSGSTSGKAHRIQFRDVIFFEFLNEIGIFPIKSKTIKNVKIPFKYFFDYVRGCFDGDGTTYSYWDKRWKSSFMFYICFASASKKHLDWLQGVIYKNINAKGYITKDKKGTTFQLKYAKTDSKKLIKKMYRNEKAICLTRKKLKIKRILDIVEQFSNKVCR